jgi:hypothetical protein
MLSQQPRDPPLQRRHIAAAPGTARGDTRGSPWRVAETEDVTVGGSFVVERMELIVVE